MGKKEKKSWVYSDETLCWCSLLSSVQMESECISKFAWHSPDHKIFSVRVSCWHSSTPKHETGISHVVGRRKESIDLVCATKLVGNETFSDFCLLTLQVSEDTTEHKYDTVKMHSAVCAREKGSGLPVQVGGKSVVGVFDWQPGFWGRRGRERESGHGKRKAPTAPQSSRGGSRGTKLHHLGQPVQIQHNFSFDLHFPYFPELWVVYRVRRIFALTWSNPVLWEPPKVSQGLREFQKPHFQSTVGFVCFTVVGAYVGGAKQHC